MITCHTLQNTRSSLPSGNKPMWSSKHLCRLCMKLSFCDVGGLFFSLPLDIRVCGWMESKVVAPNGGTPLCSLRVMVFSEAICNCALIELVFYLIRCALLILALWKTFSKKRASSMDESTSPTFVCVEGNSSD